MANNTFLESALLYASLGWRVFPLKPKTKDEHVIPHWNVNATTDEGQIRAWWRKNPNYNIGIATGNGLCVIDVDDKPDKHPVLGSDMLRDWELEHGDISETVCAKSGTGGMHYYFDVGDTRISGCQSNTIFIDLRCDGNYIVAPPSIHPDTGLPYTWDVSPEDMPPTKATSTDKACIQWVYDNRKGAKPDGTKEKVNVPKNKVKEGEGRNNFLYEQGCSARAKGSDDEMIEIWLAELNKAKCIPPLDERELSKIITSVCSKPIGLSDEAKASKRGRPRKFDHSKVGDQLMQECGACFVDGMPAIRRGDVFAVGWNAVDAEIISRVKDATRANQNEVHHYLTVLADRKRQSPPNLIAFSNGVLDVDTMELRGWRDDDVIPNIVPHDWNPDAECPEVDTILLKMSAGDPDVYQNLMEVMGCCLYRSAEFGQSAILLGGGSNGKSTYIQMLLAMLGEDNVSSLDMGMIGKQFHTGRLVGKLANLGDDISNEFQHGDLLSIFKKVVTGNRLYADVKGTEGFEFTPYCQMVFSANEFPRLADYTDGMMRRIFPIEFNAVFKRTDADYDPRIVKKVTTEAACERMCVLAVGALRNVIAQNGFSPNAASQRRVEEIKADNDTVLAWALDECRDAETLSGCVIMRVYELYRDWCKNNGLQAVKRTKFTRSLNNKFGLESRVVKRDGRAQRCFEIA